MRSKYLLFSWRIVSIIDDLEKTYTSSTAQGGGGSFKNRKPIPKIGCCKSGMAVSNC